MGPFREVSADTVKMGQDAAPVEYPVNSPKGPSSTRVRGETNPSNTNSASAGTFRLLVAHRITGSGARRSPPMMSYSSTSASPVYNAPREQAGWTPRNAAMGIGSDWLSYFR